MYTLRNLQADLYSEPFLENLLYYLVRVSWKLRINISGHAYKF